MGQPAAVVRVRLVPPEILYLLGICQYDLHSLHSFQNIENRLPVSASTLHHHMGTSAALQPIPQLFEFPVVGPIFVGLLLCFSVGWTRHHTNHHELLADIDPAQHSKTAPIIFASSTAEARPTPFRTDCSA